MDRITSEEYKNFINICLTLDNPTIYMLHSEYIRLKCDKTYFLKEIDERVDYIIRYIVDKHGGTMYYYKYGNASNFEDTESDGFFDYVEYKDEIVLIVNLEKKVKKYSIYFKDGHYDHIIKIPTRYLFTDFEKEVDEEIKKQELEDNKIEEAKIKENQLKKEKKEQEKEIIELILQKVKYANILTNEELGILFNYSHGKNIECR